MTLGPDWVAETVPTLDIHIEGVHCLPVHVVPEGETLCSGADRDSGTLDLGDVTSIATSGLVVYVVAS